MAGRVLGVDFGLARLGLAVADALGIAAHMLPQLAVKGKTLAEAAALVAALAAREEAERIVLGLPLNMDGTEGPAARRVREFGRLLAEQSRLPVEFEDERLSTVAAEERLRERELTRKKRKQRLDSLSAQVILQGWMEARQKLPPPSGEG